MTAGIKCRFSPGSLEIEDNVLILAAAVDTHYHQLKYLSDSERSVIRDSLRKKAEMITSQLSHDNCWREKKNKNERDQNLNGRSRLNKEQEAGVP